MSAVSMGPLFGLATTASAVYLLAGCRSFASGQRRVGIICWVSAITAMLFVSAVPIGRGDLFIAGLMACIVLAEMLTVLICLWRQL